MPLIGLAEDLKRHHEIGGKINYRNDDGETVLIKSTNSEETLTCDGIRKGENKQGRKSQEEWEPFQDIKPF